MIVLFRFLLRILYHGLLIGQFIVFLTICITSRQQGRVYNKRFILCFLCVLIFLWEIPRLLLTQIGVLTPPDWYVYVCGTEMLFIGACWTLIVRSSSSFLADLGIQ